MIFKSFRQWVVVVLQRYPDAVIHDARASDTNGFAVAFNGDDQVGFFDPEVGGTVEEPSA